MTVTTIVETCMVRKFILGAVRKSTLSHFNPPSPHPAGITHVIYGQDSVCRRGQKNMWDEKQSACTMGKPGPPWCTQYLILLWLFTEIYTFGLKSF